MERLLKQTIKADLAKKMVFLTGPRQAGKTTLARALCKDYSRSQYLNWDVPADRKIILNHSWITKNNFLVFDEIHKMKDWKAFLKGVFDGKTEGQEILVTGSARMETFRQSGESLAGRYLLHRLYPLSVKELVERTDMDEETALNIIMERGSFPEPFFAENSLEAERWRKLYIEGLIREDIVEFSRINEIKAMHTFVELLRDRVGSPLSLASISRDLQVSPNTVAKYLDILSALYIVFVVRPYHKNVARAILKEPKVYFFDIGLVRGSEGARFENTCAFMLLRHVHYKTDAHGVEAELHYVRDRSGKEVDFLVREGTAPKLLIECKLADASPTYFLKSLARQNPSIEALLLVKELRQEWEKGNLSARIASKWLRELAA